MNEFGTVSESKTVTAHGIFNRNNILTEKNISIDHFVPWSYVAHDELWNLHPTTKGINSSKSNNLPDWDLYFSNLAKLEYMSYKIMRRNDKISDMFNKCAAEHLNNSDIAYHLFEEELSEEMFTDKLKEVIFPVYNAAKNSGFENWVYSNE